MVTPLLMMVVCDRPRRAAAQILVRTVTTRPAGDRCSCHAEGEDQQFEAELAAEQQRTAGHRADYECERERAERVVAAQDRTGHGARYHDPVFASGHRSGSLSRSRSNRRCLSNARRLTSKASSVASATSVERLC